MNDLVMFESGEEQGVTRGHGLIKGSWEAVEVVIMVRVVARARSPSSTSLPPSLPSPPSLTVLRQLVEGPLQRRTRPRDGAVLLLELGVLDVGANLVVDQQEPGGSSCLLFCYFCFYFNFNFNFYFVIFIFI